MEELAISAAKLSMINRLLCFALVCTGSTAAANVAINNIDQNDLEAIVKESGAGLKHSIVTSASTSLGGERRFELGLVSGGTKATAIDSLVAEFGGSSVVPSIPHGGIFGTMTLPYGLTSELLVLPLLKVSGVTMMSGSTALKWAVPNLWNLPFETAVKGSFGLSRITWSQTVSNVSTDIELGQTSVGADVHLSKRFGIFEPFMNLGFATNSGTLETKGSGTIFDSSFTTSGSAEQRVSGLSFGIGSEMTVSSMRVGIEIGSVYGARVSSMKASATF